MNQSLRRQSRSQLPKAANFKTYDIPVLAYLVIIVVLTLLAMMGEFWQLGPLNIRYRFAGDTSNLPNWYLPMRFVCGSWIMIFVVSLMSWRKIGFYGLIPSVLLAGAVDVGAGVRPYSLLGLLGIVLLFFLMRIGRPSAWSQLEW